MNRVRPIIAAARARFTARPLLSAAALCSTMLAAWAGMPTIETAAAETAAAQTAAAEIAAEPPAAVYDASPSHPLNRLHGLLFSQHLVPDEVHLALPAERADSDVPDDKFYVAGWYFQKRPGTQADARRFGGDLRVSPRRSFDDAERRELMELLASLPALVDEADSPLSDPLTRLLVQWDVASVWWELEKRDYADADLLRAMARAVVQLAQPRAVLESLGSGMPELKGSFALDQPLGTGEPYFPSDFPDTLTDEALAASPWVEVDRRSSALFHGDRSLHVSRVYLNAGGRPATQRLIAEATGQQSKPLQVPAATQGLLVQQLIAFDEELQPVATPVVDDVRVRTLEGPPRVAADNPTSSRDGTNHWVFARTRAGSVRGDEPAFRFFSDRDERLFTEFGSAKLATHAAQCALCHRRTNSGNQSPEGFRVLSPFVAATATTADRRAELAVEEVALVVDRLKLRLDPSNPSVQRPPPRFTRLPPRADRDEAQRAAWAGELRRLYVADPAQWPAPTVDEGVRWQEIGLLPPPTHPADNPHSPAKEELGKMLFFDPRISGSGQIACASCHDPDLHWADGRTTSFGHSRTLLPRNAPTVRNAGHLDSLFWDGRSSSLEDQVLQVLNNDSEMRASEVDVVAMLEASEGYRERFAEAFGGGEVSFQRIAEAIACFERTIVGGRSRFDAFVQGVPGAFSDAELIGLDLFRRDARCMNCHSGPAFTDGQFHEVGLSYYGRKYEDLGRYEITGDDEDAGRFRTPTLRDVTKTTPLMHNGLFELPGVLNMYNAGMPTIPRREQFKHDPRFPVKSPLLKPLGLNRQDLADLEAFLGTLEEPKLRVRPPDLPPIPQ